MADLWILFPIVCIGMMLYFMLVSKDSNHGGCMGMMHAPREKELEKEIADLKDEVNRLRKRVG